MDFTTTGFRTECTTVRDPFMVYIRHEDGRLTYQLVRGR
jgi:hypothetical protein